MRNQLCTLWFDEHIAQGPPDEFVVAAKQTCDEAAYIAALLNIQFQRYIRLQYAAGCFGEDFHMRIHHGYMEFIRHGQGMYVQISVASNQDDTAEQAGRHIVGVKGAGSQLLALHSERKQFPLG